MQRWSRPGTRGLQVLDHHDGPGPSSAGSGRSTGGAVVEGDIFINFSGKGEPYCCSDCGMKLMAPRTRLDEARGRP